MSQTQELHIELFDKKVEDILEPLPFIVMGNKKFQLKKGCNNIGRDPQMCSIVISNSTVSKLHSVIEFQSNDDVFIYDNGSTNKTMLGKKYLQPQCRYKLEHETLITLGNVSLKFILVLPNIRSDPQKLSYKSSGNTPSYYDSETEISVPQKNKTSNITGNRKTASPSSFKSSIIEDNETNASKATKNDFSLIMKKKTIKNQINSNLSKYHPKSQNKIIVQNNDSIAAAEATLKESETQSEISFKETNPSAIESWEEEKIIDNAEKKNEPILNNLKLMEYFEESDSIIQESVNVISENLSGLNVNLDIKQVESDVTCSVVSNAMLQNYDSKNVGGYFARNNTLETKSTQNFRGGGKQIEGSGKHQTTQETKSLLEIRSLETRNINPSDLLSANEEYCGNDTESYLEITILDDKNDVHCKNSKSTTLISKKSFGETVVPLNSPQSEVEKKSNKKQIKSELESDMVHPFIKSKLDVPLFSPQSDKPNRKSPLCHLLKQGIHNTDEIHDNNGFNHNASSLFGGTTIIDDSQSITNSKFNSWIHKNLGFEKKINIHLQQCLKNKDVYNSISLTKSVGSVVPESSDEDSTLSDLEIIYDSPYVKRGKTEKNNCVKRFASNFFSQNRVLHPSSVQARDNLNSKQTNKKEETEDSDLSDSSYVFDIINNKENTNQNLCEDQLICNFEFQKPNFSDSDSNDVIETTPPPCGFSLFNTRNVHFITTKNQKKEITGFPQKSSQLFERDNDSGDYGSFASIKIPSPKTLEGTLKKIMEKGQSYISREDEEIEKETPKINLTEIEAVKILPEPNGNTSRKSTPIKRIIISGYPNDSINTKKPKILDDIQVDTTIYDFDLNDSFGAAETLPMHEKNDKPQHVENVKLVTAPETMILSDTNKSLLAIKETSQKLIKYCNSAHCSTRFTRSKAKLKQFENTSFTTDNDDKLKATVPDSQRKSLRGTKKFLSPKIQQNVTTKNKNSMNESDEFKFENSPVKIAFTGYDSDCLDQIINELGGEKTEDLNLIHVLITDQIRRTVKFLCAIGLAIPITSPEWLLASHEKKRFLNPWDFILKNVESEKKWNFDLREALKKSRKQKLLKGFSVFATESVKPPVDDILCIVECCGGIPLRDKPRTWTKQTIVVSCQEDKKSWPPWKFRSVKIVHYEFILSGVLQQNLDFKTYKLR